MSKEQELSSSSLPPVKNLNSFNNTVTSLPPLPDDFLSFQPHSSTHFSIDDNNVTNSLNNIKQEQQQSSYRGDHYYNNRGKRNYYNNYNTRSYHSQQRGYHGGQRGRGYSPRNNFGGSGGGRNNNYSRPKKRRFNEGNKDISLYYMKSFLEDPWADLMEDAKKSD